MAESGQPLIVRFMNKVEVTDTCWNWTAAKTKGGYGVFGIDGKTKLAHRISYEFVKGKIKDGLQLDHTCRNRGCVNPVHLRAVTQQENIKIGLAGKINNHNKVKVNCPQGHSYTPDNLMKRKDGKRGCKVCCKIRSRVLRAELKASI